MVKNITHQELEAIYSKLINMNLSQIQCDKFSVDILGELIDSSFMLKKEEGLLKAIKVFEHLKTLEIPKDQHIRLFYYGGNAYHELDNLRNRSEDSSLIWDRELVEQTIISYRKSLSEEYSKHANSELRSKIFVNLGNIFNHLGRFVEAQNCWNEGLKIAHDSPLALCNKGLGFYKYSRILYDNSHKIIFLKSAFKLISEGLKGELAIDAKIHFQKLLEDIQANLPLDYLTSEFNFKEFNLGRSKKEREYRYWCLKNCLYLNPLNEIGEYNVFAHDLLSTPPMRVKKDENLCPRVPGIVNQIKMEFINARYLLYLGLNELGDKFVNKDSYLIDTLDYPEYGINLEFVKTAFRITYSILDRIAFTMDDYYELKMPKKSISFKSVWGNFDKKKNRLLIRKEFDKRKNWALRGLYWLSKDLFESGMYRDSIELEARELAEIRNHLEHKYLKIHYMLSKDYDGSRKLTDYDFVDTLSYSLERGDFESKALKLIKIVREAIIYFLLSININEEHTRQITDVKGLEFGLELLEYKFY